MCVDDIFSRKKIPIYPNWWVVNKEFQWSCVYKEHLWLNIYIVLYWDKEQIGDSALLSEMEFS